MNFHDIILFNEMLCICMLTSVTSVILLTIIHTLL
jgi:hypothetical protein